MILSTGPSPCEIEHYISSPHENILTIAFISVFCYSYIFGYTYYNWLVWKLDFHVIYYITKMYTPRKLLALYNKICAKGWTCSCRSLLLLTMNFLFTSVFTGITIMITRPSTAQAESLHMHISRKMVGSILMKTSNTQSITMEEFISCPWRFTKSGTLLVYIILM